MPNLAKVAFLRRVFRRMGRLQPIIREINSLLSGRKPPSFSGWQMTTWHHLPWEDGWEEFRQAAEDVRSFEHSHSGGMRPEKGNDPSKTVDALLWRHWNVAYSVHHAFRHTGRSDFSAVECGVADGMTANFAAAQGVAECSESFRLHLYDSWSAMREDGLTASEGGMEGRYGALSQNLTRRNLERYGQVLHWHPGRIPATLDESAPEAVSWLHIDLNSAKTTIQVLDFFFPRIWPGRVVLLDDYGWDGNTEMRLAVYDWLSEKTGTLLPLPTGQAIFFN